MQRKGQKVNAGSSNETVLGGKEGRINVISQCRLGAGGTCFGAKEL